jgi:hypothetical protein
MTSTQMLTIDPSRSHLRARVTHVLERRILRQVERVHFDAGGSSAQHG